MPLPLVSGAQRNRCRAAAREQVTVALAMIDGIEAQIAPLDKDLRAYAHRQAGCKALIAHYGIGPLVADLRTQLLGAASSSSSQESRCASSGVGTRVAVDRTHRAEFYAARLAEDREAPFLGESVHCGLDRGFHFLVDRVDVVAIVDALWVLVEVNR